MTGVERLLIVQEKLKQAGVRDVKFCWAPDAFKTPFDELCGNVADWLEAYLRGDFSEVTFADGTCPNCKGSGDTQALTQHLGPDDYTVTVECPECKGTGSREKP